MSGGLASINIRFTTNLSEFSSALQNQSRQIKKLGEEIQGFGEGLTIGLTAPIIAFGVASVLAFDDSAQAVAQVDAALKSTGGTVGYTSDQLQKMAGDLQNITTFDDDEILKKATANLLTFSKITGDTFQKAQKAALDLSTRLDGDLQGAAIQVGKALNDPIKGLTALSKVGVSFSASQKETIKSMVATNDIAGAQSIILNELQKEFGGSAEAAAKAGLGGFRQLGNIIGDLSEDFGKIVLEAVQPFLESIKGMILYLKDLSPEAKKTIALVAGIAAAIGPLVLGIGGLITMLPTLAAGFAVLTGPIGLTVAALAAVAYVIADNWDVVKQTLVDVANYFIGLYNNSVVFRAGVEYITLAFKNLWAQAKFAFNNIKAIAEFAVRNIFNYFTSVGKLIKAVLTLDVSGIKAAFKDGFSSAGDSAGKLFDDLKKNTIATGKEIKENVGTAISNTLNGKKIAKIKIPKEAIDTSNVSSSVSSGMEEGAKAGAEKIKKIKIDPIEVKINAVTETQGAQSSYDAKIAKLREFQTQIATTKEQVLLAEKAIKQVEFDKALKFNPETLIQISGGFEKLQTEMAAKAGGINASIASIGESGAMLLETIANEALPALTDAFSAMGAGVVESLGLAENGFQGFIGGLLQTVTKLIAMMLASAISQSIAGATAAGTATGPAAIFTTPAFIATAVGGVLAAFASIPKFETGGIVGGSSFYGDKIMARVNSGELILNDGQQRRLHGMLSDKSSDVNITLGGGFVLDGSKLKLLLKRTDERDSRVG